MNTVICLDAGHGGKDPGACGFGLQEKVLTLIMLLECKKILQDNNIQVVTTRESDIYMSLDQRCKIANNSNAILAVSFHVNAGGGDGAEAIHSVNYGQGTEAAKTIVQAINQYTGQNLRTRATYSKKGNNGKDYFAWIRNTRMSAVIIEGAFIDNEHDVEIIDTIEEQKQFGRAIAYGILKHLYPSNDQEIDDTKDNGTSEALPPSVTWNTNAVARVALDPRDTPSANYKDLGEIYKNERFYIVPEVYDNGFYLPALYWKDSINQASEKCYINANQKYISIDTNGTVINVITELDARYNPTPDSARMGYVKQGERLLVHYTQSNYSLCTYFAGSGHKTAWFTSKYIKLD